jgi:hypothetical protein
LLRRLGEVSLPYHGMLIENGGEGWVQPLDAEVARTERTAGVDVRVDDSGFAVVDLRALLEDGESVVAATSSVRGLQARFGEDVLLHGDFEDWDVDEQVMELSRWNDESPFRFACLHDPYRGTAAACTVRNAGDASDVVLAFRNRIRVLGDAIGEPNKALTLVGYARGDNAGPIQIVSRYYASELDAEFGEEIAYAREGGDYDWTPFSVDLSMPEDSVDPQDPRAATHNARALRLFLRHSPPQEGLAVSRFEDLAVVSWRAAGDLYEGLSTAAPNPLDFLRVEGPQGTHRVELTFQRLSLPDHP